MGGWGLWRGAEDGETEGHEVVVGALDRGHCEVGGTVLSGEDQVQYVASFVCGRGW